MGKKKTFSLDGYTSSDTAPKEKTRPALNEMNLMQANQNYNFKFIPIEKIVPNMLNSLYEQTDIEELKLSIEENGLVHNLVVIYDIEEDNYRLISGERRYRAIQMMDIAKRNKMFPSGIPCKVENANLDKVDEEIKLISANSDVREVSTGVRAKQVERLLELYRIKKEKGEISNIAEEISAKLQMSKRQTLKYIKTERLIPELSEKLHENGMNINDAAMYAELSIGAQKALCDILEKRRIAAAENGTETKNDVRISQEEFNELKKRDEEKERLMTELKKKDREIADAENLIALLKEQKENAKEDTPIDYEKEYKAATRRTRMLQEEYEKLQKDIEINEKRGLQLNSEDIKKAKEYAKAEMVLNNIEEALNAFPRYKETVMEDNELRTRLIALKIRLEAFTE